MCNSKDANASGQNKSGAACNGSGSPCGPIKPSKCTVQFRPKTGWQGEYGFDWLRIGDTGEATYQSIITSAFSSAAPATAAAAFTALKTEYSTITSSIVAEPDYYVPYLNLFPKGTAGTPVPPFEAELLVKIAVEEEAPDKIEIEFDKTLFALSKTTITDTAVGAKRDASDGTLKITCIKEFDADQSIRVYAYPPNWETKNDATLAGKIIVCKNSTANRKDVKFVLVNVKTKIKNIEKTGSTIAAETTQLTNSLFQGLIKGTLENGPVLDLTRDNNFKIKTVGGHKTYGKFIYKKTSVADTNIDGALNEDFSVGTANSLFAYVRSAFLAIAANNKYQTGYFTVFAFGEVTYDPVTHGQIEKVGVQNLLLFVDGAGNRMVPVMSHEALHGLGLHHTHDSLAADNPYNYTKGTTNNIMSYNFSGFYETWHWQWPLMQKNL